MNRKDTVYNIVDHITKMKDGESLDLNTLKKQDLLNLIEVSKQLENYEMCVNLNKFIIILDRDEKINSILK